MCPRLPWSERGLAPNRTDSHGGVGNKGILRYNVSDNEERVQTPEDVVFADIESAVDALKKAPNYPPTLLDPCNIPPVPWVPPLHRPNFSPHDVKPFARFR